MSFHLLSRVFMVLAVSCFITQPTTLVFVATFKDIMNLLIWVLALTVVSSGWTFMIKAILAFFISNLLVLLLKILSVQQKEMSVVCGSQANCLYELLTHLLKFCPLFQPGFLRVSTNSDPYSVDKCFVSWRYKGMHTKWQMLLEPLLNDSFEIWGHSFRMSVRKENEP